jgi:hypothetical protein
MKSGSVFKILLAVVLVYVILVPELTAQASELNQKPCLYDGVIDPHSGTVRNRYTASVHYYDPDGKKPVTIQVYVDDINYTLKRASGKSSNGLYTCRLTLPPGEHSYYFYTEDDNGKEVRFPRYGVKKGPFVNVSKPWIKPAQLSNGGLTRKTGTDKTFYTYTVHYNDPQDKPPQKINVIVDNIIYPMHLHKGSIANGTYIAVLALPPGPHAYYFKALDALKNCITLPEEGFIRGPEVTEVMNSSPKLLDVKLDPILGYPSTPFTYYVTYNDEDYDPPSIINIVIDGTNYPLQLKAGSKYNGVYHFRSKQYLGNFHNYYFYCEDGRGGSCRMPATGTFHGPVVVK